MCQKVCEGIYRRCTGDVQGALEKLMPATKVPEHRALATKTVVEILCNWDVEVVGSRNLPSSGKRADAADICATLLKVG